MVLLALGQERVVVPLEVVWHRDQGGQGHALPASFYRVVLPRVAFVILISTVRVGLNILQTEQELSETLIQKLFFTNNLYNEHIFLRPYSVQNV